MEVLSGREDIVFSLPGLVPVSLPVPQEVFPEFGSLDFSEAEQMIDDKKKVPKIFQNWLILHFLCFFKVDCAIQLASRLCFPKVALSLTAG